ncbi:MAG: GNAT family N-acetyltransferase [Clostridia bacterium]|nr:GNAT family N-acetyltransferase [Clostridia bacterium]
MITIRKYEDKDCENVKFACLNAEGYNSIPDEATAQLVIHTFCEYYIEREPENCFVVDDDGRAVGFIISAESFEPYKKVLHEEYCPLVEPLGETKYNWSRASTDIYEDFKDEYPVHFHINILPEYQRVGAGGKLLNALFDHYKNKSAKGIMLCCSKENEVGLNFYKKYGFTVLKETKDDVAFGMKL